MKQEVVFQESHLPPLEKETKKKSRSSSIIFNVVIGVLLAALSVTIGYVGQIIYNNLSYRSFFVNGMSMYPTINRTAYATSGGQRVELSADSGNFDNSGYSYRCETGLYDRTEGFIYQVKRFSIVCTYYSEDYYNDGSLKPTASAKIKRVVGLPREWLYYDSNSLYISQDEGMTWLSYEETFLQPQSSWGEKEYSWREDLDNNPISFRDASNPYKLGEDEYFVCGDNRRHSNDSRVKGAVTSSMIDGVVVLLNGETDYYLSGGSWRTSSGLFDYYFPWNYRYL